MRQVPIFVVLILALCLGALCMHAQQVMPILGYPVTQSGGTPTNVTDNFNRADENPLAGNWTTPAGQFQIFSNQLYTASGVTSHYAYWNANTFANNQYASLKVITVSANWQSIGPAVRIQNTGANGYYVSWHDTNVLTLFVTVAGTDTSLGTSTAVATDVIRIEASGTSISVKKNGSVVIGPVTDSNFSSGKAGVGGSGGAAGVADDWAGGDL